MAYKREYDYIDGRIYRMTGGFFVAVAANNDNEAESICSPIVATPLEALDWLYAHANQRAMALSVSISWKEPTSEKPSA
jgi:hypothetical protein